MATFAYLRVSTDQQDLDNPDGTGRRDHLPQGGGGPDGLSDVAGGVAPRAWLCRAQVFHKGFTPADGIR